jgi:putative membrane protein
MYYSNGFGHMMGFGYGVGWLWFWGLLVFAVLAIAVWSINRGPRERSERRPSPEETLKDRFARGEIDLEDYRARLEELRR